MTKEEFDNLQNGDKVRLVNCNDFKKGWGFKEGDILTRKKDWLDCDLNVRFDGEHDHHWFYAEDIELIKEVE